MRTPFQKLPYVLLLIALLVAGFWPSLILQNIQVGTKPILQQLEQKNINLVYQKKR